MAQRGLQPSPGPQPSPDPGTSVSSSCQHRLHHDQDSSGSLPNSLQFCGPARPVGWGAGVCLSGPRSGRAKEKRRPQDSLPLGAPGTAWPRAWEQRGRGLGSSHPFTRSLVHSASHPVSTSRWELRTHSQDIASGGRPRGEARKINEHVSPGPAHACIGASLWFPRPNPACITGRWIHTCLLPGP